MRGCMFRYYFDINLAIPKDRGFHINLNGRNAFLRFITIEGEKITSFTTGTYVWLTGEEDDVKHYLVKGITQNNKKIPIRQYCINEKEGLNKSGIIDKMKYTIVEVMFNIEDHEKLDDDKFLKKIKNDIRDYLDYFTDVYRLATQDMSFEKNVLDRTPIIEILTKEEKFDLSKEIIEGKCKFHKRIIDWSQAPSNYNKPILNKQQLKIIGDLLQNKQIRLSEKILIDAKEEAHINKNYEVSVILSQNAFEVFVQNILIESCKILGIKKLQGRNKKKNFKEAITNGNIRRDLLKKYLTKIIGENLSGGKHYNRWYNNAYSLRNDIIHKGKYKVSSEEAKNAFLAVRNFINIIIDKVNAALGT